MKQAKNIRLSLSICAVLFAFSALYSDESSNPSSSFKGKQWVEECVTKHPEISWLADANVRKTEEGHAALEGTYSERLFGQKYVEFDRTIMTIHCLRLILDGSDQAYVTFTAAQPVQTKLSKDSFNTLHLQAKNLLESKWGGMTKEEIAQAMETALVLGDMGKSEKAREKFKRYGIKAPDHDDFYGEAIQIIDQNPTLCPSFSALPSSARKLLVKVANLAHYGHITHLEGNGGMFTNLKKSALPSTDPIALSFDLFVHTCDVAGALGHVNNESSIVYTEPTHLAMQSMASAVRVLSDPNKSEKDAYNTYLETRASWLGLNLEDRKTRVLSRIGAMLRLFTPEDGAILKKAILELNSEAADRIALQLDLPEEELPVRTPTYIPAVLVNLSNNPTLGKSKEERLSKAITIGLPFIARVLETHKQLLAAKKIDANIPLNFNQMALVAKTSPDLLSKEFYIDHEGVIRLKSS